MKKQWLLLVVVLVVALGYWLLGKEGGLSPVGDYFSSPSPSSNPVAKSQKPSNSSSSPAPVGNKSYTDLIKEYDGRRIQFDQRCQAVPVDVTYKNGTSIMLDNRSGDARNIKVGKDVYVLAEYGYKIITLSGTSLPQELVLSCGSAGNVGKILLQAQLY